MDGRQLAAELSPWLDIDTVLTAGRTYERHPDRAAEDDHLVLHHPQMESGNDGDIVGLITEYVENFYLPPKWLSTVFGMGSSLLEIETWRWFHDLRFTGKVDVDVDVSASSFPVPVAHVLVHDSWAVTEILQRPLSMLFGTAVNCLENWKPVVEKISPQNLFLRARDDGALAVHVDGHVASALGVPSPKAAGRIAGGVIRSYRSVTAVDTFDNFHQQPELLEVAGDGLNALAAELRE